jgi:hypothetical protein
MDDHRGVLRVAFLSRISEKRTKPMMDISGIHSFTRSAMTGTVANPTCGVIPDQGVFTLFLQRVASKSGWS